MLAWHALSGREAGGGEMGFGAPLCISFGFGVWPELMGFFSRMCCGVSRCTSGCFALNVVKS